MFHDPTTQALPANGAQPVGAPHEEARVLLARYPSLSEIELARLINHYRRFSALDTALLLSDDDLAPRLDRFTAEQRSKVRLPLRQYAGLLVYTVLTLAAVAWAIAVT
jgi:hypothetical protein